jgi:hypothetical protein
MLAVLIPVHVLAAVLSIIFVVLRVITIFFKISSPLIRRGLWVSTAVTLLSGVLLVIATRRSLAIFCLQGIGYLSVLAAVELAARARLEEKRSY